MKRNIFAIILLLSISKNIFSLDSNVENDPDDLEFQEIMKDVPTGSRPIEETTYGIKENTSLPERRDRFLKDFCWLVYSPCRDLCTIKTNMKKSWKKYGINSTFSKSFDQEKQLSEDDRKKAQELWQKQHKKCFQKCMTEQMKSFSNFMTKDEDEFRRSIGSSYPSSDD